MSKFEDSNIHNEGMSYECFLTRAFKTDKRITVAHKQEYINLANAENGQNISFLPPFYQQLKEVKNRLEKAVNIFIDKTNNNKQLSILQDLKNKISEIESYKNVKEIIDIGLENTGEFK